jgi:hypothetical protein
MLCTAAAAAAAAAHPAVVCPDHSKARMMDSHAVGNEASAMTFDTTLGGLMALVGVDRAHHSSVSVTHQPVSSSI